MRSVLLVQSNVLFWSSSGLSSLVKSKLVESAIVLSGIV